MSALLLSGTFLVLIAFLCFQLVVPSGANIKHFKKIESNELAPRVGSARTEGDEIIITDTQQIDNLNHALISARLSFQADNYPFLRYTISGVKPGQTTNLVWRSTNQRGLSTAPMPLSSSGVATIRLTHLPNWSGQITELGIHLIAKERGTPVKISGLSLEPYTFSSLLASTWSEWTWARGWGLTSINLTTRTPGDVGATILTPTVVIAVWTLLGLLLLRIISLKAPVAPASYGILLLCAWISADIFWQVRLVSNSVATFEKFYGKSLPEKLQLTEDAKVLQFVNAAKEKIPDRDVRVFVSSTSDAIGMLSAYYLSPLNVYWHRGGPELPESTHLKVGDYILLANPTSVDYDSTTARISSNNQLQLDVEPIYSSTAGMLLKVAK